MIGIKGKLSKVLRILLRIVTLLSLVIILTLLVLLNSTMTRVGHMDILIQLTMTYKMP